MNDTPPNIKEIYRHMLMCRSGEERLKMGCSMYTTARKLIQASVLAKTPYASPAAIRQALFIRIYGTDFDSKTQEKILEILEKTD